MVKKALLSFSHFSIYVIRQSENSTVSPLSNDPNNKDNTLIFSILSFSPFHFFLFSTASKWSINIMQFNIKDIVKLIYQHGMSQEQQALNFGIQATLEKPSTKFKQN
jgi:hypothetical protein